MTQPDTGPVLPISLFTVTGKPVGQITSALSTSVTWRHNGTSTAAVTLPLSDPLVNVLADPLGVVLARIEYGGLRFTGYAVSVQGSGTAVSDGAGLPTPNGTVTVTLTSDWSLIGAPVAFPAPTMPVSNQTSAIKDMRSGSLETVIKGIVSENAARLGLPIAFIPPVGLGAGPFVGPLSARMTPMLDVIQPLLAQANWRLTTRTWFPGEDQPYENAGLSIPTAIVDLTPTRSTGLEFSAAAGSLLAWDYTLGSAGWDTSVVGGNGTDNARTFVSVTDPDRRRDGGGWRASEDFTDARDIQGNDTLGPLMDRGVEHNIEGYPKSGVSVTVRDGSPSSFGTGLDGYLPGDTARIDIFGQVFTDRVTAVTVTETPSKGLVITPQIGDTASQGSVSAYLLTAVRRVQAALSRIQGA